ncbi:MAG: hypothetical protein FJX72_12470 [Armatimonadetes bacterium]|nr:hypothetical protein [Armatimonadota bacterium]
MFTRVADFTRCGAANPVSLVWDGDHLLNEYRSGGVSCRYDVLDGEVFGERRDGSRYLYIPDPLGSVNYLLDTSRNLAGCTRSDPTAKSSSTPARILPSGSPANLDTTRGSSIGHTSAPALRFTSPVSLPAGRRLAWGSATLRR